MSLPPPNLPPPPSNLPAPNLPPPAAPVEQRVISKFEQAPASSTVVKSVKQQIDEVIADRPVQSRDALIAEAKVYLWRRGQPHVLRNGLIVAFLLGIAPYLSIAGIVLLVGCAIYAGDYFYRIIQTTLEGKDEPPDWPSFQHSVEELVKPGVRMSSAFLISHAVLIVVWFQVGMKLDAHWLPYLKSNPFMWLVGAILPCFYFPFAAMMIVFQERFGAWWPHFAIGAFTRCKPAAMASVIVSLVLMAAGRVLQLIPYVGFFASAAVTMIGMIVLARIIGMTAAQHRHALAELH